MKEAYKQGRVAAATLQLPRWSRRLVCTDSDGNMATILWDRPATVGGTRWYQQHLAVHVNGIN